MRKHYKVIIMTLMMLSTLALSAFAAPSEWAADSVFTLNYIGILDEEFSDLGKLQNNISREEFAELALKMYLKAKDKKLENIEVGMRFTDTKNPYVGGAYNLGIVDGIDSKTFAPNQNVTREQIATMLIRALKVMGVDTTVKSKSTYTDSGSVSEWAAHGIDFISQEGIMEGIGDNKVAPKEFATREQAMVLIQKIGIKYNYYGDFKTYSADKFTKKGDFTVPKREITQLSVYSIDSDKYDLNIVLKGYTSDGTLLDIENQNKQVYDILKSNDKVSYKALDAAMRLVKSSWNVYSRSYQLEKDHFIDIDTGKTTTGEPDASHIKVSADAILNIRIMIK